MRALWLVLDSVGCGAAPDARDFGDEGADTLGHLFEREGLVLPHLASLGLYEIMRGYSAVVPGAVPLRLGAAACRLTERSIGKDTTTGHWELAGNVLEKPFATFETFPADFIALLEQRAGVSFLGNCVASGTEVLTLLGEEHCRTGQPILYTSVDSVLQIAAHEDPLIFGLDRLLDICRMARELLDERGWLVGRVIARPFVGRSRADFQRTANRRDFSLVPAPTVLDRLQATGVKVTSVGKISDIFAGQGISESHPTKSNAAGMAVIEALWQKPCAQDQLIVCNLVDFDMLYGHRRDPRGYAQALREFDSWLGAWLPQVGENDFVCITADHGNDPYHRGTDHTREQVPLLTLNSPQPLREPSDFTQVAELLECYFLRGSSYKRA
jgi:phosphopentomutase